MPPRKKAPQPPPSDPPRLCVPLDEAHALLQTQIDEGEALFATNVRTTGELAGVEAKRKIWSEYNRELLRNMFTTSEISDRYNPGSTYLSSTWPGMTEEDDLNDLRKNIQDRLTDLRSIQRRLPLYTDRASSSAVPTNSPCSSPVSTTKVFLVHGHNDAAKETVARYLERFGLEVIILHEQPSLSRTIIEKFEAYADVGFAVVLLTSDDLGCALMDYARAPDDRKVEELRARARQNVILELGFFIGRLGRERVAALMEHGLETPSDIAGVLYIPLDSTESWKLVLAREMKAAGMDIDMNRAI